MRAIPLILALVLLASAVAAQDAVVSLPLLLGDYDAGYVLPNDQPDRRSCTFTISPDVLTIDMMHMIMSGTGTEGAYITERDVGGTVFRDTLSYPCQMFLVLTADPLDGAHLLAGEWLPESGVTDAVAGFTHSEDAALLDFNLLLNTTVGAELICYFGVAEGHWIDPLGTVTDLHLRIQGQTVPTATSTWGDVKAIYR